MTLIKSISGIRGTIGGQPGNSLTPIDVVKFTAAYAATLPQRKPQPNGERYKVVVGKDARMSGDMVEQLVVGTLAHHNLVLGAIGLGFALRKGGDVSSREFNHVDGGEGSAGSAADGSANTGNGFDQCHIICVLGSNYHTNVLNLRAFKDRKSVV